MITGVHGRRDRSDGKISKLLSEEFLQSKA
jgi:hypothetical protein